MKSIKRYIVLSRVGLDGGFSEIIGICDTLYDAEVSRDVDIDDMGTTKEDYKIEEWYV